MKLNDWDMFRLEDRVLFEAAAAAEIVDAAEAAQDNPNANVSESEKQAQEEREALKNAPPENPSQARPNGESQNIPGEPAGIDAELDKLINGEIGSADLAADAVFSDPGVENGDVPTVTVDFIDRGGTVSTGRELVVINSSVADADDIVASLKPNQEALLLDPDRDAMEQINDYFNRHDGVKYEALHILSHGNDGYFVLNGEVFNAENFDAAEWAEVGEHLTGGGDILLYGCNLADGKAGRELIGLIADASGADVAASDDATGVSGDWELEYRFGTVEAESIAVDGYMHNLTNYLVVNANSSGEGSFAWAVSEANKHAGTDEITFADNVTEIRLSGALTIDDSVTISGYLSGDGENIVTITAAAGRRIFSIDSGANVVLENLNFEGNGTVNSNGGAIYNSGNLTLNHTDFSGFHLSSGNRGGVIYNYAEGSITLNINDSVFHDNSTSGAGGGVLYNTADSWYGGYATINITDSLFFDNHASGHAGGAIYLNTSSGTLTVDGCIFRENSADGGGAIANYAKLILKDTLFESNHADSYAGALISGSSATVTASGVRFAGNSATGDGGAVMNYNVGTFKQCVFEGNIAYEGSSGLFDATCGGGAIFNQKGSGSAYLSITDCLFADNRVDGGSHAGGAINNYGGATLVVVNTTFHGNGAASGGAVYNDAKSRFYAANSTFAFNEAVQGDGAIRSLGTAFVLNSIAVGNGSGADITNSGKLEIRYSAYGSVDGFTDEAAFRNHAGESVESMFENGGALTDNGGHSKSVALSEYAAGFAAAAVRMQTGDSDGRIYAFFYGDGTSENEVKVRIATPGYATATTERQLDHDQRGYLYGSAPGNIGAVLREGYVAWSGAEAAGDATHFYTVAGLQAALDDGGVDTLYWLDTRILLDGQLTIGRDLAIVGQGSGETILVSAGNGIFQIQAGDVTISDLAMTGNGKSMSGDGGAVVNRGTLTLADVEFSGLTVTGSGGAVWNAGTLTAVNVLFAGNAAASGGAVFNRGSLSIDKGIFTGNKASGSGGAIANAAGTVRIDNSYFGANAAVDGGAVWNAGTAAAVNSTFDGNAAAGKGSAWFAASGVSSLVNDTIAAFSDDAAQQSAGVYAASGSKLLALNNLAVSNGAFDFFAEDGAAANLKYNVVSNAAGMDGTNLGGADSQSEFGGSRYTANGGDMPGLRVLPGAFASQERNLIVGEKDGSFYFTTGRDTGQMQWIALDPAGTDLVTGSVAEAEAMYISRDGRGAARMLAGFYGAGAYAGKAIWGYYFTDPAKDVTDILEADVFLYMPERGGVNVMLTPAISDYASLVGKTIYLADGYIDVKSITVSNDADFQYDPANPEAANVEFHFVGGEHTVLSAVSGGSILTVNSSRLPDGSTRYDAALPQVVVTIENVAMTRENVSAAPEAGGCIYVEGNVVLTLNECEFYGSSASFGGAVYGSSALFIQADRAGYIGPAITLDRCEFRNCSASYMGGAVYINDIMAGSSGQASLGSSASRPGSFTPTGRGDYEAGKLTVTGSVFDGNSAEKAGGAIAVAPVSLNDMRSEGKYSYYIQTSFVNSESYFLVEIRDSVFSGNAATLTASGGGAIFMDLTGRQNDGAGKNFVLADSTFSGNTAGTYGGGAVFFCGYTAGMSEVGVDVEIDGNFFSGNSTAGDGGAIRLTEDSNGGFYSFFMSIRINVLSWHVVEQEIELRMASASAPAAMAVSRSGTSSGITFELDRNTFSENSALRAGGAFSSSIRSTSLQVDMVNSTLAFNEAGTNGGAIDARYEMRLNLIDSTVACNTAANGGISADAVVVNVINSIVLGNGGGEFAVANGGEIHTAYSIYGREAAGTVATDTHSQYAVLNEVFGKDLLAASDLTAYGTLAISAAGLAFTSGTQVAKVGDDFYFLQDGAWVDMKGNTTTVSRADYIMAAQDSSAANGIVRVETSRGGFNVGAHAMVEISVEVSTEKSYDGTTAAPVDGNGGYIYSVDGIVSTNDGLLIGAERVELEQLEYTDKNAGRDIPLNVKGVLGGFEDGSLYIVTFSGKGDIHKAQLTVTGNTDTQIYNGKEHTVNGWSDVSGLVSGDALQSVAGIAAGTDVGEYDQVLSDAVVVDADGSDMSGNYEISYIDGKLTINPAKVIVTVDAVKTYDGTTGYDVANGNHTVTVNSDESGLLNADDFALESFEYGGKNVGKYTEADGTNGNAGYIGKYGEGNFIIDYVYTGTINKAALVVSGNTDTQIYNGKEHAVVGWSDVTGLVSGDALQSVAGVAAGTDVGEYDQVLSDAVVVDADGSDMSGNYEISYIDGKLTINPAKVIVTVDAVKTYDGTTGYDVANGNHTVTVNSDESGLLGADDFALESFEYGGKNVGKYTEADGTNGSAGYIGKYGADNFIIDYVYTGTIRHAVITVDVNAEKVYDANTRLGHDEADYALAGRIGNDDVDFDMDSLQAEYADANVHSGRELTGMAGSLTGGDSGNYILVLTGKGTVTPRHVTVTADEQSKLRGDDDPILTWKHTGGVLLQGDSIDGTLIREPGEEVGDYTILNDTLQVNNPNYILHYVENLLHITENPRDNQPERIPDSSINEWQQPYIYNLNYTMSTAALGPGSAGFYWEPRGIYRFEAPTSILDPIPDGENSVSGSLNLREADDSLEDYLEIGGVRWETILNRHTAFKDDFELLLDDYIGDAFYGNARAEAEMAKFSRALY